MATDFDFDALLNPQKKEDEEQQEFDFDSLLSPQEEAPVPVSLEESQPVVEEVPVPAELTPPKPKTYDTPEEQQTDDMLSFQELASDGDYMDMLREYSADRMGDEGKQEKDESNEDYLKRFLSHTREFEFNSIDLGQQLDWVRTANEEQRMKFGYLYSQLDRLPSFYEEGGTSSISAMRDFGKALITDPLNYIGFGAGKVASTVATRAIVQAMKEGGKKVAIEKAAKLATATAAKRAGKEEAAKLSAKRMLGTKAGKIAAGGVAVEAGAAAVQDLKLQEVEMLTHKYGEATPDEKSLLRAGLVGTVGLAGGALGVKLSGGLGGEKLLQNARQARIKQYKIAKELNARNKELAAKEAGERAMEATTQSASGIFDTAAGRETLDMLGDAGESGLTQTEFNTELMQRMGRVVTNVVEDLAESGRLGEMVDVDTKASEVIGKIVSEALEKSKGGTAESVQDQTIRMLRGEGKEKGLGDVLGDLDVDGDTLQGAISKAGLTTEQFVNAFGTSFSDAGKYLQTTSKVGKIMKGIKEVDPELAKQIIGDSDADSIVGPLGKIGEMYHRVDRERRALMVTQVATTIRNIATAGTRLTMDMSADLIESTLYQFGRGFDAGMTGNASTGAVKAPTSIVRDAFGRLDRMRHVTGTAELTDALLKHNPRLASRMDRTLEEQGAGESLTKVTRMLNGLNIAQDLFFRRAIFTDAVDKRLRRAGVIVDNPQKVGQYKSLEEFAAAGRPLPAKVLSEAVEDSLDFTFSRMPKPGSGRAGDTAGYWFLKFNETLGPVPGPIGTAAFPFGRFMVNALQFQMKYMPTSAVTAAYKVGMGKYVKSMAKAAADAGDMDLAKKQGAKASKALAEARSDFSKSLVGTAALIGAIKYRADNQDIKLYEARNDDGSTSDLRPFFPLTPYLALADIIVKLSNEDSKPIDVKEFLEAFTGAQFRTGASSYVLENADELIRADGDTITTERLSEIMGGYVGEIFGGGMTPLRVVRDIQAAYDTEAAVVRDARQVEGVGGRERFVNALKNTVAKDIPGLAKDLPAIESPTREGDIYRQSPLVGQITGLRREAKRNPAEAEFERFGIKRFEIVPGSGDKMADAAVKKALGPMVEERITRLVQSEEYLAKSDNKKRAMLNNRMRTLKAWATQAAKIETSKDKSKPYTPFDRAQYSKLNDVETRLADEYYKNAYDGKTVVEMQELEPEVNHLKKAIALGKRLAAAQR
tara:strand:+ start:8401 stop:12048 length:3648 start_codon:yes stop_codon:yes gene_type:complete